ncbi:MAG TPA: Gfo/Idh/MocA family oxidoreductase [Thermomicrobiales bacterium]|nr:Gfo/Idh/MocA family oxidoreductase [Thermomicrobiales bacterium]
MAERKLGIGVIGCGRIAHFAHLNNLARNPRVNVVAVADIDPVKARETAEKWGIGAYYEDYRDVIAHPEVEAVDVTTWPTAHAAPVIAAAAAGKHILCEKPIATTMEDADAMVAAAERAGVKFAMGYRPQFGRVWPAVKQLVDEGVCGRLMGMSVIGLSPSSHRVPWFLKQAQAGGGILMDWGIYTSYFIQWLLGPVESVYAQKEIFRKEVQVGDTLLTDIDVEDTVAATLRFRNGAVGTWYMGWAVAGSHSSTSIDGSEGSILLRSGIEGIGVYTNRVTQPDYLKGWRQLPVAEMPLQDQHYGKLAHLVDAVLDDKPLVQTGAAGRDALELVLAIYRAAETGQAVTLPLPRNATAETAGSLSAAP